jgi:hypothetical protein
MREEKLSVQRFPPPYVGAHFLSLTVADHTYCHLAVVGDRQLGVDGRNSRVFQVRKNCKFNFFRVNSSGAANAVIERRIVNLNKADAQVKWTARLLTLNLAS